MSTFPQKIERIARKFNLKLLVYFGSYMTEQYNSDSDIDIAYLAENQLSVYEKIALLQDLIKAHKKSEIDLVDLQTAEPVLRCEIAINGKVIYEKKMDLFEYYSLYYIKRFYELKPIIQEELRNIKKEIREVVDDA